MKCRNALFWAFFLFFLSGMASIRAEANEETEQAGPTPEFSGIVVHVPDILSNLQGDGRRNHFLKLKISFEATNNGDAKRMNELMPYIIDQYMVYLRELRIEDLEGAEGLFLLRQQLLERANTVLAPVQVVRILFREILVQ